MRCGSARAVLAERVTQEVFMAHTHEFDCVVCGAHFDDEKTLQRHNQESHVPKQAIDTRAPAEPMGTERSRHTDDRKHPSADTRDGSATPRFGSATSGGGEFEHLPTDKN
jgi:hypothetical protein